MKYDFQRMKMNVCHGQEGQLKGKMFFVKFLYTTMASKRGKNLIVDDNAGIRRALEILLPLHFAEVKTLPTPATLVSTLEQFRSDVVLLDMNFNTSINTGNEGLYWAGEIKKMVPEVEVVLFTAYTDIQLAI